MSYSNKWCRDTLTTEQLAMFLWSAENERADHIVDDCTDINGDGEVNVHDILALIAAWGCDDCVDEDVNDDGTVDVADLLIVIANWGPCE